MREKYIGVRLTIGNTWGRHSVARQRCSARGLVGKNDSDCGDHLKIEEMEIAAI